MSQNPPDERIAGLCSSRHSRCLVSGAILCTTGSGWRTTPTTKPRILRPTRRRSLRTRRTRKRSRSRGGANGSWRPCCGAKAFTLNGARSGSSSATGARNKERERERNKKVGVSELFFSSCCWSPLKNGPFGFLCPRCWVDLVGTWKLVHFRALSLMRCWDEGEARSGETRLPEAKPFVHMVGGGDGVVP